jgi:hypothetical protein
MIRLWRTIKSIFVNDAHNIISERGKILLAEEDSWEEKHFKSQIKRGVEALASGKPVQLYESVNDRSYELALEIKKEYLLMKQRELAKKIKIDKFGSTITISWNHD